MTFIKVLLQIIVFLCYSFTGGILFHQKIAVGYLGIELIFLGPLFILFSVIGILFPFKIYYAGEKIKGWLIWVVVLSLTCILLSTYHYINNRSKVIFSSEIYWDAGIRLYLRENGTFKVINDELLAGSVQYGEYEVQDRTIIIKEEIRLGSSLSLIHI